MRKGGQVTKRSPLNRTDSNIRAAVSRVQFAQGKRTNWSELGRIDSQEKHRMRCRST